MPGYDVPGYGSIARVQVCAVASSDQRDGALTAMLMTECIPYVVKVEVKDGRFRITRFVESRIDLVPLTCYGVEPMEGRNGMIRFELAAAQVKGFAVLCSEVY
jgi:hypothetical protein